MDEALQAMRHHQDSMENIQLFMMQISHLMRDLTAHVQSLGEMAQSLDVRMTQVEIALSKPGCMEKAGTL